MKTYIARRIGQFIPVLLLAMILIWGMIYALPGSPAEVLGGTDVTPERLAAINKQLGLDQPLWVQFGTWVANVFRGDFGMSYINGFPVADLIADRLPATIQLSLFAMVVVIVFAIPLGVTAALGEGTWSGRVVNSVLALGLAIPTFWLGILLILGFSISLGLLPAASEYRPFFEDPWGAIRNTLLPALALGIPAATVTARFIAASMRDVMGRDFVRTARAKGAGELRVVSRHGLRNALLPAVTMAGVQFGHLLGGAIVIEVVFTYPGLGRLLYTALNTRDYSLIQAIVLLAVVLFLVMNVVIDILYAYLDPRIRLN